MVFVGNTEPEAELRTLTPGKMLHVLGIPRINLAEVAAVSSRGPVDMALPYEMIVVAVFPEDQTDSGAAQQPRRPRANPPRKK